jgi:hypothetical protein
MSGSDHAVALIGLWWRAVASKRRGLQRSVRGVEFAALWGAKTQVASADQADLQAEPSVRTRGRTCTHAL